MTTVKALTIFISFGLFSCNSRNENSANNSQVQVDSVLSDTIKSVSQIPVSASDTMNVMVVDDYALTNEMLADKTSNNSSYKKKSGEIFSLDKAWFTASGQSFKTLTIDSAREFKISHEDNECLSAGGNLKEHHHHKNSFGRHG
jgi:hypothetical protein